MMSSLEGYHKSLVLALEGEGLDFGCAGSAGRRDNDDFDRFRNVNYRGNASKHDKFGRGRQQQ